MRKLIAGNWKMNGDYDKVGHFCREMMRRKDVVKKSVDVLLAPPFPYLMQMSEIFQETGISLAGQDCHFEDKGAYTGEVSAKMLKDVGCDAVILGHSERREFNQEDALLIGKKIIQACNAGLHVVLCVGETAQEHAEGKLYDVLEYQIQSSLPRDMNAPRLSIAYEPRWAIGTGKIPSVEEISKIHEKIFEICKKSLNLSALVPKILYGGSVNASNAVSILQLPSVGGALVGGASLEAESFLAIAEAAIP